MKQRFILLLAGLLALLASCAPPRPAEDGALHVLASTYPIYLFATAVAEGVDGVEVELLVNQPTACLHDYTLTVQDMKAIERADVLLLNGGGLEDFLEDALSASAAAVIDCSQGIALLPALGHDWTTVRTVPTQYGEDGSLIQEGYTLYECSRCGTQYKDTDSTGPPGNPGDSGGEDSGDDKESIWDKIGNFFGSLFGGIGKLLEAVLGKLLDALASLAGALLEKLSAVIETVLNVLDELPKLFGGFLDFLGILFPFLPSEITLLLTFGVVAVVFAAIIKAIRS